jgi:hypothetical protein
MLFKNRTLKRAKPELRPFFQSARPTGVVLPFLLSVLQARRDGASLLRKSVLKDVIKR